MADRIIAVMVLVTIGGMILALWWNGFFRKDSD